MFDRNENTKIFHIFDFLKIGYIDGVKPNFTVTFIYNRM